MKITVSEHVGEVIEANSSSFLSQALQDPQTGEKQAPRLGSLLKAHNESTGLQILGVVSQVTTRSADSVHRPVALNLTRQQLREQQPQIFDLLSLEFEAVVVGYWEKGFITSIFRLILLRFTTLPISATQKKAFASVIGFFVCATYWKRPVCTMKWSPPLSKACGWPANKIRHFCWALAANWHICSKISTNVCAQSQPVCSLSAGISWKKTREQENRINGAHFCLKFSA
jgi:hypothetical protein